MPVDFRYHLASLLAVFCALLIGIFLGMALVGTPSLEAQRAFKKERDRNRETIERLNQKVERLEEGDRYNRAFAKQVLPALTSNRLQNVRIAVILNRDLGDTPWVEEVLTTVRQAGAQVTSVTAILPNFLKLKRAEVGRVFTDFGFPMPIEGDPVDMLIGKLAVRITEGSSELAFRLRQLGAIRVQGDYDRPADCVLLIGGTDSDLSSVNAIDLPMIRALQEVGQRVVACEATTNKLSCIRAYQRRAISTVDNADTPAGQLALVLVLAGAAGDFGVRPTADQLLPNTLAPGK